MYVSGLSSPVAFVQDPSQPTVQFVVEQAGRIRVIQNGALLTTPFLDITSVVGSGGERGLLGLAFAPDYATSGRFWVNFTNVSGNTVVARFLRSTGTSQQADQATRFDLVFPGGTPYIVQPFANHNGGDLHSGPDGYLYIAMGDGGAGNDPMSLAQDMTSLHGKILRIDVNVSEGIPSGVWGGIDSTPGARPSRCTVLHGHGGRINQAPDLRDASSHWAAGRGVHPLRDAAGPVGQAAGDHGVAHGVGHRDGILRAGDRGVHEHAVGAQFHGDCRV